MSSSLDAHSTAYVTAAGSGDVFVIRVQEADGHLQIVQQLSLGGALMPMAWSPDRQRLHVVCRSEPFSVHTLSVEPSTGLLNLIATTPLAGNMAFVSTSLDGRFLLTASYGEHCVAVHAIGADGTVQSAQQVVSTPRHAHAIRPAPDGQSVWISCLGDNVLVNHAFNTETGHVAEPARATVPCRHGSGPRHFVFHPQGQWLFLINELDGTVDTYEVVDNGAHLRLAHSTRFVDEGLAESPWAAEIRLNTDGSLLFASDRRSHAVTSFLVDQQTGQLRWADRIQAEALPRSMAVSGNGRWLFVVGQQSNHLGLIQIDQATGHMQAVSRLACGTSPTWVKA